jgi:hypothetical protein
MGKSRELLWVDADEVYVRSLSRLLRVHWRPQLDVKFRIVERAEAAWRHVHTADALIADPSIGDACVELA